jgi:putative DNA primase/helicase
MAVREADVSTDMLARARKLVALGVSVIPLAPGSKEPAFDVLPRKADGKPEWEPYKTRLPSEDELLRWFGNGANRGMGIVTGQLVVVESDKPEAEAYCREHFNHTPMQTQSARGLHRYFLRPTYGDIPATRKIGTDDHGKDVVVEIKRDGQYVVAPGSVHPGKPEEGIPPGHVYAEVQPWPDTLDELPVLPLDPLLGDGGDASVGEKEPWEPLPSEVDSGNRNTTLFREGFRLRKLGWQQTEIAAALHAVNKHRCKPPLLTDEVERIADSCMRYPAAADTYPLTEAGDAEYFAASVGEDVRYDHRRGRWLLFAEHHWTPQTNGEVYRLALDAIRGRQAAALQVKEGPMRTAHQKWAIAGEARRRQTNLLALAQNVWPIADAGENWDVDPWLLGVQNGVVDLQTGRLRDGRPEDRITMRVRAPYDHTATCPLWTKTLGDIFRTADRPDEALIAYFARFVGYSLTGDCREEVLALCFGEGANGKGTVMNTLGWLLGDYADDLPFSALELQERGSIPNDIAKLVGKRFVTSSETAETRRLNETRVKALTGRDPMTARFLHQEWFTFQPVAKFWLATNHLPEVRDTSKGFWRRIHTIPFTQSFGDKPDLKLKDKLRDELPGILAWAVRGCLAWQREGLAPPAAVREATESYRAVSLPLVQFVADCCKVLPTAWCPTSKLREVYVRWCRDNREHELGANAFVQALRQHGFTPEQRHPGRGWRGIGLVSDTHSDADNRPPEQGSLPGATPEDM